MSSPSLLTSFHELSVATSSCGVYDFIWTLLTYFHGQKWNVLFSQSENQISADSCCSKPWVHVPVAGNRQSGPKRDSNLSQRIRATQLSVCLYRSEGVSSKECNLKPRRDEDPCCVETGKLWKVCPNISWGSFQDGGVAALSVEDFSCSTIVHISPERCHNPSVTSDWKSHRCKLRHLPQERYQAIVVYLMRRIRI